VQIDLDDFKRHYAMLSDDALLEINRDELVDAARVCYDAELADRKLARPDAEENVSALDHPGEEVPVQKAAWNWWQPFSPSKKPTLHEGYCSRRISHVFSRTMRQRRGVGWVSYG